MANPKDIDQKPSVTNDPTSSVAPTATGPVPPAPPSALSPQLPSSQTVPSKKFAIDEPTGNLTRDSIIAHQRGKFIEAGKSEAEAHELAVKRGFEIIREEPAQK